MRPTDFYTVPKSESGVRMPIPLPTGADSGEWLLVVGPDSLAFGKAAAELNKAMAEAKSIEDEKEREKFAEDTWNRYVASLILGWSFSEPFTPDAVLEFVANAPRVAQLVQNTATDPARFFGLASPSSTDGQTSNGDSRAEVESVAQSA